VECTAQTIPEAAVAHIAHLEAGGVVKVKDLELPEGVRPTVAEDEVIASCLLPGQKLDEAKDRDNSVAEASGGEEA